MFEIRRAPDGAIHMSGRLDASQAEAARAVFLEISESAVVDFGELTYISSAGLSVLLQTQKRLMGLGERLTLANLNRHIHEVFRYAGFDSIFDIR